MRIFEQLFGRSLFDDLSHIHEHHIVGNAQGLSQGVGDHDDAISLTQFGKKVFDVFARYGVECRGRLVGQDKLGLHGQSASQAQSLLLADGKGRCRAVQAVFHLFPQVDAFEVFLDRGVEDFAVAHAVYAAAIGDVVVYRHGQRRGALREQPYFLPYVGDFGLAVVDVFAAYQYASFDTQVLGGVDHAVDAAQQGGLSAPRRPDDAGYFLVVQGEVDVFEYMVVVDIDVQTFDFDDRIFVSGYCL